MAKNLGTRLSIVAGALVIGLVGFGLFRLAGSRTADRSAESRPVVSSTNPAASPIAPPATTGRTPECKACRVKKCTSDLLFADCKPMTGVVRAGRRAGKPKREACEAVVACIRDAACTSATGDPRRCYCGTAEDGPCLGGSGDGPCKEVIEDAAESTSSSDVATRWTEPQFALAQAVQEVGCLKGMCKAECLTSGLAP